jgi:xanthosine utilization system XapX-like protein
MVCENLRSNARAQIVLGLITGVIFGFLLQKGGVTNYDVIIGQLLLTDFTVVRIMLSAIVVGMIGIFLMKSAGVVRFHVARGSIGATVVGGLVFGTGFAVLGYCPGTAAAAFGAGAVDALIGMIGIAIGAGIFARVYPVLNRSILKKGSFPADTIPELIGVKPGIVVIGVIILIIGLLYLLAVLGL